MMQVDVMWESFNCGIQDSYKESEPVENLCAICKKMVRRECKIMGPVDSVNILMDDEAMRLTIIRRPHMTETIVEHFDEVVSMNEIKLLNINGRDVIKRDEEPKKIPVLNPENLSCPRLDASYELKRHKMEYFIMRHMK